MNERILAAAQARAAGDQRRAHPPRERRMAEVATLLTAQRGICDQPRLQLRAADEGGSGLDFAGYATVYERGYEMWDFFGPYTEIVSAGAGAVSLERAGLDVPLVLQHDSLRRIARTTNGSLLLSEDDHGLLARAPELDPADADVAYIAPKIRAGLVDEMSFMFRIIRGQWSPDYMEYRIEEYDIHRGDVAIVGYGANPATEAALRGTDDTAAVQRMRARLALALA